MSGRRLPGRRACGFRARLTPDSRSAARATPRRMRAERLDHTSEQGRSHRNRVASSISHTRQRQMIALLLWALAVLTTVSLATYRPPAQGFAPWSAANACGPAGATLAFVLVSAFGRLASYGVPLLALAWGWNRFRDAEPAPLALSSVMGGLLLFEACTLAGLGRWSWAGGWGIGASNALHSALGWTGSWIVAAALFGVTALAASELGFHWVGRALEAGVAEPARGLSEWWSAWRERAASARPAKAAAKKARARVASTAGA